MKTRRTSGPTGRPSSASVRRCTVRAPPCADANCARPRRRPPTSISTTACGARRATSPSSSRTRRRVPSPMRACRGSARCLDATPSSRPSRCCGWTPPSRAACYGTSPPTRRRDFDAAADAEPGKILHEVRYGEMAELGEIPFRRYYGSVDSTPLFVMLAAAYLDRTGDLETTRALWPSVQAALEWIAVYGDCDGDGFVEYHRQTDEGLANQGWKDSHDSISHEDGSLAQGPIALVEVRPTPMRPGSAPARLARASRARLRGGRARGARGGSSRAFRRRLLR